MSLKSLSFVILSLLMSGCAEPPATPVDFRGGVGFACEAQKDSSSGHDHGSRAVMVIGFEKGLGGGVGIGGELNGR